MSYRHFPSRVIGIKFVAFHVILAVFSALTLPVVAGNVAYLPGMDREGAAETLGLRSSPALLIWELPGGLLLADRLAAPGEARIGRVLSPAHGTAAKWFIVDARRQQTHGPAVNLNLFGTLHLEDNGFSVLEVPAGRLEAFASCPLPRQQIPLGLPPEGWERYAAALQTALNRDQGAGLADPAAVADLLAQASEPSFRQVLKEISGAISFDYGGSSHTVSTRYYNTADKTLVADYLADKLAGYGYTVEFDHFIFFGTDCRNVVATVTGTTYPDEYVVLGAHYDSTSQQPSSLAPGAEDNGSGTSLVMEVARMAAGYQFERSVQFVLFDSEEQGLNGSEHFVDEAIGAGRVIVSAIIADMVTYYDMHYGVRIEGETEWESLMSTMQDAVTTYTPLSSQKDYYSWGSDHVPFQQAGIPAFLAIDWDWSSYPYYHSTGDNWAHVAATAHIGYEITLACTATLAEVAGLQATEDTVSVILNCIPTSGTVPFETQMTATLTNDCTDQMRRIAGRIDVQAASGAQIHNWRAGYTDVAAGASYVITWSTTIPYRPAVIGENIFTLVTEDVTPAPYNQPPYPAAGDTASDQCVVTAAAPAPDSAYQAGLELVDR